MLLVGFIAAAAYMIFIVITSGAEPSRGDAYMCWESGKAALAHNQTYFLETPSTIEVDHNWTPAVYFSIYPFQLGFVTCSEVLHALFGEVGALYAMRLLNLAAILYTIYVLAVFSESLVKSKRVFKLAFFFLITCWPLLNYVSYTYGNWLGLGFVMGALHLQYLAMQAEKNVVISCFP